MQSRFFLQGNQTAAAPQSFPLPQQSNIVRCGYAYLCNVTRSYAFLTFCHNHWASWKSKTMLSPEYCPPALLTSIDGRDEMEYLNLVCGAIDNDVSIGKAFFSMVESLEKPKNGPTLVRLFHAALETFDGMGQQFPNDFLGVLKQHVNLRAQFLEQIDQPVSLDITLAKQAGNIDLVGYLNDCLKRWQQTRTKMTQQGPPRVLGNFKFF